MAPPAPATSAIWVMTGTDGWRMPSVAAIPPDTPICGGGGRSQVTVQWPVSHNGVMIDAAAIPEKFPPNMMNGAYQMKVLEKVSR